MANQQFPLGRNARLYFNSNSVLVLKAGASLQQSDLQTWLDDSNTVAGNQVINLSLALDDTLVSTNTREATEGGFMSETPVLHGANVTFGTSWDMSSTLVPQLVTSWSGFTQMAFGILNRDQDTLSTGDILNGFVGNFWVSLSKDENSDDVQRANWSIRYANNGTFYSYTEP